VWAWVDFNRKSLSVNIVVMIGFKIRPPNADRQLMEKAKWIPIASFVLLSVVCVEPTLIRASGHGHAPIEGVSPDIVLKALEEGNRRFATNASTHPNTDPVRRASLASGQKPSAIVLSCSDSRVPPEMIFDQGLGDVFSIRVAGNVLGAAAVASIEYALEHLGSRLIVVMGHESCGAVKAALHTPRGKTAGSPDLDHLITTIQPYLEENGRQIASSAYADDKILRKPVMMNVDGNAERLMTRSKIVRNAVESGRARIVRAIYSLETGKVSFWGADAKPAPVAAH
jgi:carbonic anhydrase